MQLAPLHIGNTVVSQYGSGVHKIAVGAVESN
jgi:hypothetical protein